MELFSRLKRHHTDCVDYDIELCGADLLYTWYIHANLKEKHLLNASFYVILGHSWVLSYICMVSYAEELLLVDSILQLA